LGTVEFTYNNKIYSVIRVSPFKANLSQDPQMGFKRRRKRKHETAEKFVERMKEIQEEARAVLVKAQEEMKCYADKKRSKREEYKVGDWVMLSTKDLKWQIKRR